LVTTVGKKLTFHQMPRDKEVQLKVYTDSDHASEPDRISISGSILYLNGCPVSWHCKKQKSVALSSTEVEFMALSDATRETLYVYNLVSEIVTVKTPLPVLVDNKGARYIAENDINNKLTKHIDIRYHFTRLTLRRRLSSCFTSVLRRTSLTFSPSPWARNCLQGSLTKCCAADLESDSLFQ